MANTQISALPVAIAVDGTESVPVVQGGVTKRATTRQVSLAATSASETFIAPDASIVKADVGTVQTVFDSGEDTVTLAADTAYQFEAIYAISRSAGTTSHTTSTLFGGTAVLSSIGYAAETKSAAGSGMAAAQARWIDVATAVAVTGANSDATENLLIHLRGIVRIATAGTFIPQFQYSVAPGGAPTVLANSQFRLWPIGAADVTTYGNVS